jgi:large repetitive protein
LQLDFALSCSGSNADIKTSRTGLVFKTGGIVMARRTWIDRLVNRIVGFRKVSAVKKKRSRTVPLMLESLEDRAVPSVTPAGGEFLVNSFTNSFQFAPAVAVDADGDFVVAWDSLYQDGSSDGIYAQRYDASGVAQGGEFQVNSYTSSFQAAPSVAIDADGDFVVAWQSNGQDGSSDGIYAQRYDAAGVAQGGEFQVNSFTSNRQRSPSVAMDADGDFVVAWQSDGQDGSSFGIYAQRYDASGTPEGGEFRVNSFTNSSQNSPSVAMDVNGDFVVAWQSFGQDGSSYGVYAQRYDASGTPEGGEFRVNSFTSSGQASPSVAMDVNGDFVVAWQSDGQDGSLDGIYAQRYDASGIAQGGEFQVNSFTSNSQASPSVAMDVDGDFVVTWQSQGQDGSGVGIYAQRYDTAGVAQGSEFQVNSFTNSSQAAPSVAMDADGSFVAAWQSDGQDGSNSGIYAQRYHDEPTAGPWVTGLYAPGDLADSITPGEVLHQDLNALVVAFSENLSLLGGSSGAYSAINPANWGLTRYGQDVSDLIESVSFRHNDVTNRYEATLNLFEGLGNGDYQLTVSDAISDRDSLPLDGDRDGVPGGSYTQDFSLRLLVAAGDEFQVNSFTNNSQSLPSVAMDADGDYVVAWQSYGQDGSSLGIYAQRYDASGVPQGAEFQVNSFTSSIQGSPSVAMDANGDFVVAWQSLDQDGSNFGIYAQRYDATGVAQGAEFQVNSFTSSFQRSPSVAMDADGDFVVTWQSFGQDGSFDGIYAQRYDASGVAQGAEFQVNSFTNSSQNSPSVAMDADGDFVVTWQSNGQDGSGFGIYSQRYDASGVAQGAEFQVNSFTNSSQASPSVAMDADGDFLVAWQSDGQDGSLDGVYAQRYDASGVAQGAEFQVNSFTNNSQRRPSVAMDVDGDFVVTWQSYGQDGSFDGIYAQRYDAAGVAQGGEFQVNTFTNSTQGSPSVAMDANGDFVVAWESDGQDGSSYGIYAQRYVFEDSPTTSGLADLTLNEDDPAVSIDLRTAFNDRVDGPAGLSYLVSVSDPTLLPGTSIDPATDVLTLQPAPNASGTATVTVRATDSSGLSVEDSFLVTVNAVNDAPVVSAPSDPLSVAEDVDLAITGLSVGDIDSNTLTVTLEASNGTLTLGTTTGLGVTGEGTVTLTLSGAAADINTALATLLYRGGLNFSGSDTLTVTASDGSLSAESSVSIVVQSASEQAAILQAQVEQLQIDGVLTMKQAKSLTNKLNLKGNDKDVQSVGEFLNLVQEYRDAGILSQQQADALLVPGGDLLLSVTRR